MPSKGTAHNKTKKHHRLNVEHYERMKGVIPLSLASLKRVAAEAKPEVHPKANTYYCEKCKHTHKVESQIGKAHKGTGAAEMNRKEFIKLPMEQRNEILKKQAEELAEANPDYGKEQ